MSLEGRRRAARKSTKKNDLLINQIKKSLEGRRRAARKSTKKNDLLLHNDLLLLVTSRW